MCARGTQDHDVHSREKEESRNDLAGKDDDGNGTFISFSSAAVRRASCKKGEPLNRPPSRVSLAPHRTYPHPHPPPASSHRSAAAPAWRRRGQAAGAPRASTFASRGRY